MRTEIITFPGARGESRQARLLLPPQPARACALFIHCFACAEKSAAPSQIGLALVQQELAVLQCDLTGLQQGPFHELEDLLGAAVWLKARGLPPRILIGHSLGGAAVIAAAAQMEDVRAVATVNAPSDPAHLRTLKEGEAELGGSRFPVQVSLLDRLREGRLLDDLRALRKPLMIFHAPQDREVSIDDAARLYVAAFHPKSFVSLDGADHLLTNRVDAIFLASVLAAWSERYIGAPLSEPWPADFEQEAPDRVRVEESGEGRLRQRIAAGRHELFADEPVSLGGTDTAPTPYDLLVAGLGACTTMTLRLYADRKGWPLEKVAVDMNHRKVPAEELTTGTATTGKVDLIERTVRLQGPLDEAQRQRLLEIADRCPVHRTLTSEVVIETSLEE